MAKITLNSENLATEMNRRLYYSLPIFNEFDAIIKNLITSSNKVVEYSHTFMENFAKIDFAKIDELLKEALKELYQFLESVEKDKEGDYAYFIENYSAHLEKSLPYVTNDIKSFFKFWIRYNIRFLDLTKDNYREQKYNLFFKDFTLFNQYLNLLTNKRISEEEALEGVWNSDERNISKINILSLPEKVNEKKKISSKEIKTPTNDQRKFLKAFVEKLGEGHKKTYAIEEACKSSKYSKRQGQNLYKEVREGSLKYEPLSEILNERKLLNNNDVII